jgi:hypothetical protein
VILILCSMVQGQRQKSLETHEPTATPSAPMPTLATAVPADGAGTLRGIQEVRKENLLDR